MNALIKKRELEPQSLTRPSSAYWTNLKGLSIDFTYKKIKNIHLTGLIKRMRIGERKKKSLFFNILFLIYENIHLKLQGWGTGKFFSGSGSWLFFKWLRLLFFSQAAPAPAPGFFFKRLRLQGAKNTQLRPAPAPAPGYWLSLPKYSFPHKLVR